MRLWFLISAGLCQLFLSPAHGEETSAISGQVVHVVTKKPVPGVRLGLGFAEGGALSTARILPYGDPPSRFETLSDASGHFRIQGIPSGQRFLLTRDRLFAGIEDCPLLVLEPGESAGGFVVEVARGASISGVVWDETDERPIEGAVIEAGMSGVISELVGPYERIHFAVTDAEGHFRLGALPQGEYTVDSAPTDGFGATSGDASSLEYGSGFGIPLRWDQHHDGLEIAVTPCPEEARSRTGGERTATLSEDEYRGGAGSRAGIAAELMVMDAESGEPVEEFGIRMWAEPPDGVDLNYEQRTALREPMRHWPEGRIQVRRILPFPYRIVVDAPEYHLSEDTVDATSPDGRLIKNILLKRAVALRGRIIDTEGRPLRFVRVHAEPEAGRAERNRWPSPIPDPRDHRAYAFTSEHGDFVLAPVPEEPLYVTFWDNAYPANETSASPEGGVFPPVEMVMTLGGSIRGRITEGGRPLPRVEVAASGPRGGGWGLEAVTDDDGYYEIREAPPGPAKFLASYTEGSGHEYGRYLRQEVVVEEGRAAEAHIDFMPGTCTLEGTVTWNDEPERARVIVVSLLPSGQREWDSASTRRDGSFVVRHLPDVPTRVHASSDRGTKAVVVSLFPHDTENVSFELASGVTLAGRVEGIEVSSSMTLALLDGHHEDVSHKPGEFVVGESYTLAWKWLETPSFGFERVQPGKVTLVLRLPEPDAPGRRHARHRWHLEVVDQDLRDLVLTVPPASNKKD